MVLLLFAPYLYGVFTYSEATLSHPTLTWGRLVGCIMRSASGFRIRSVFPCGWIWQPEARAVGM
ncbi:MAG: hypothetical protein EBR20_02695 [Bacteroidetes bacterium]|nr:hypothetical protein [Bacteroidota bacterium]